MSCPCGSGLAYDDCCGPFHQNEAQPATAEQLMRSRYSAYVKGRIDYLVATQDPETQTEFDAMNASTWAAQSAWKRLEILKVQRGKAGDDTGVVEFIAWFTTKEGLSCHHETSTFRKLGSRWVYTTGSGKPAEDVFRKLGRNEDCPCGSGKKFKKCHAA